MRIEYGLDRYFLPKQIHIVPCPNEDVNVLHSMASRLIVQNPAIKFSEDAKAGLYNDFSDDEYEKALAVVKRLSLLFQPPKAEKSESEIDLFNLTVRLLYEYMLNQHSESSRII